MGVKGLWKAISTTSERAVLRHASSTYKIHSGHKLRVGVDMSAIMAECTAIGDTWNAPQTYPNAGLQILFRKLAIFLRSPVEFLFVYDGVSRPAFKRGLNIDTTKCPDWTVPSQDLLRCFGFGFYQAPGEAEADLAEMNARGLIDAVMTSDSDVFVFGACTVYRTIPHTAKEYDDEFLIYESVDIRDGIGLGKEGLVLFALLCGGDYHVCGVRGCGPGIALGLVRAGFGDSLIRLLEGDDFDVPSLDRWRTSLVLELQTNNSGLLPRRAPSVANRITSEFPDLAIVNLYLHPITSWSNGGLSSFEGLSASFYREPSPHLLACFFTKFFGPMSNEKLRSMLCNSVLEGVFLQMLCSPVVHFDSSTRLLTTPNGSAKIVGLYLARRRGRHLSALAGGNVPQARFAIAMESFLWAAGIYEKEDGLFRLWVHAGLLPDGMSSLLSG